ncbi:MAG: NADP-dependent oxidoreductase, partial [Rhodospirillales bacterium]|nr:NADP-dependent oxidoreductase [Acetobacter sp.]
VFALTSFTRDGAAADYVLASSAELAIKPSSLAWEECASIPLSALTAYQALLTHADAQPGQKILITGAGGGVGVMAVQLAVAARLNVTAVCSPGKAELVKALGAHNVVDYTTRPLSTLSHDYDIALDTVGSSTLPQLFPLLKGRGQIICVARPATAEEKAQRPDVGATFFIVEPDGEELTRVAQCVEQEHVRAVVGEVFGLERGGEAFGVLGKGRVSGKVVISVDERVDSPKAGM